MSVSPEVKVRAALAAMTDALKKSVRPAAVFTADMAGAVLLHMLMSVETGTGISVLLVQDKSVGPERLKYMDKLRRMWGLDTKVVNIPGGMPDAVLSAALALGADCLFAAWDAKGTSVVIVNPLSDFSDEDLAAYMNSHGLPVYPSNICVAGTEADEDDEVAEKLKLLGYL